MVAAFPAGPEPHRVSDNIFNEVDEDLRRDRALKLWQKYGNYVIGLAVAVVLGTAGFVAWRDYDRRQAEDGAVKYVGALDRVRGDAAAGAAALETVVREAPAGYVGLARLQQAALKARDNPGAAGDEYRAIAVDTRVAPELRNAASLLAVLNTVDASDPAAIERQVATLATPGNAWRHLAWEVGALAALKAGNAEQARALYTRIADDPEAPAGLRGRAAEMLAALGS
jgi:hypothetical protein